MRAVPSGVINVGTPLINNKIPCWDSIVDMNHLSVPPLSN
jgi:hypothetical protein